jgi:SAM-dependent methyltransferase
MIIDQIYQQRFGDIKTRQLLWSILTEDFFQKYVNEDDVVLDLPCGYAEFINKIKCKKKYAADINKDCIKYVGKDVKFLLNSSTKLSLGPRSIDKIFVSNFFEHLNNTDIIKTAAEFKRILKPGGQILILQPNIRFATKNYWMFFDHINAIDDRALEELFVTMGFSLKKRILKFLPFTTHSRYPIKTRLVKLYIKLPFLWKIIGKQSFLIFEKQ